MVQGGFCIEQFEQQINTTDMIETRTIPLVKGDGVGPEVTGAMVRVVDAAVDRMEGSPGRR